jgi:hypothetical protein
MDATRCATARDPNSEELDVDLDAIRRAHRTLAHRRVLRARSRRAHGGGRRPVGAPRGRPHGQRSLLPHPRRDRGADDAGRPAVLHHDLRRRRRHAAHVVRRHGRRALALHRGLVALRVPLPGEGDQPPHGPLVRHAGGRHRSQHLRRARGGQARDRRLSGDHARALRRGRGRVVAAGAGARGARRGRHRARVW